MNIMYFVWQMMVGSTTLGGQKKGSERGGSYERRKRKKEERVERLSLTCLTLFSFFFDFFNSKNSHVSILTFFY